MSRAASGPGRRSLTRPALVSAMAVALGALLLACVPPPAGTVVVPGVYYSGEYSIITPGVHYYDGSAGDILTIEAYSPDGHGSYVPSVMKLIAPGGGTVSPVSTSWARGRFELPTDGRYKIELRWPGTDVYPHKYYMRVGVDEYQGPLVLGVLPTPPWAGGLYWTYEGTAGETLNLYHATIEAPDGSILAENGVLDGQVTLPVSGTYTVLVLYEGAAVTKDVAGGPVGLGSTTTPPLLANQHIHYTYSGTAGEVLGAYVGQWMRVTNPDGSILVQDTLAARRVTLPASGTYTITISPFMAIGPGPVTYTLSLAHDLLAGPITEGTTPWPAAERAQSVVWDYAGTAGEELRVRTIRYQGSDTTCPFSSGPDAFAHATHVVVDPGGAPLPCTIDDDGTYTWAVFQLTQTGTHRIVVTPQSYPTGLTEVGVDSSLT